MQFFLLCVLLSSSHFSLFIPHNTALQPSHYGHISLWCSALFLVPLYSVSPINAVVYNILLILACQYLPFLYPNDIHFGRSQAQDFPFYTCGFIWLNYQVLSKMFKMVALSFSYLNSVRHISVLNCVVSQFYLFYVFIENWPTVFFVTVFLLFSIM